MKIKFDNVTFYYNHRLPDKKAILNHVNLEIVDNEFIGLIGPSGSGKTTLIQHFTGLLLPCEGKVLVNDMDISNNKTDLDLIRKQIGIVFQFPEAQLFEESVYDDVAFGPRNFGLSENEIEKRLKYTFNLMGIELETIRERSPFKLSEGEKRRVALAGIIAMDPEIFILDEPTACLDAAGIRKIEKLLINLHALGKAIILVSHNLDFVVRLCERVIVLQEGKVSFDGSKHKLLESDDMLKIVGLQEPRIVRYCRELFKLGYVSENNLYSVEGIKSALRV